MCGDPAYLWVALFCTAALVTVLAGLAMFMWGRHLSTLRHVAQRHRTPVLPLSAPLRHHIDMEILRIEGEVGVKREKMLDVRLYDADVRAAHERIKALEWLLEAKA